MFLYVPRYSVFFERFLIVRTDTIYEHITLYLKAQEKQKKNNKTTNGQKFVFQKSSTEKNFDILKFRKFPRKYTTRASAI